MYPILYYILISVGNGTGNIIYTRGCAPFNKDFFPAAMQKGMAGDYWKVRSITTSQTHIDTLIQDQSNVFSMCDFNNCNSGPIVNDSLALHSNGKMVQATVISLLICLFPSALL